MIAEIDKEPGGWTKFDYYRNFNLNATACNDVLDRVDARQMSQEEFMDKYEKTYTPCIVTHAQENWQAKKKWTFQVSWELKSSV